MGDFVAATDSISPFTAILWCFYPVGCLVLIELILRAINDDDDDQDGGKGIRVDQNQPLYAPSGA
jgi:cytochrome c-type biogenesis protein CcmH/NrfF|tara:strand:- start:340 stop:534 length:195 start_codon:yes stop_codon:yes gene_type:complete